MSSARDDINCDSRFRTTDSRFQSINAMIPPAGYDMIPENQPAGYYSGCNWALLRAVPAEARMILDVGCAAGHLGAALKRLRPARPVVGIEGQAEVAAPA